MIWFAAVIGVYALANTPWLAWKVGMVFHRWRWWRASNVALLVGQPFHARLRAVRMSPLHNLGRVPQLMALADWVIARSTNLYEHVLVVNARITAGRYQSALETGASPLLGPDDPWWPLLQVNLAEAEYNLGSWKAALERLDKLRARGPITEPISNAGEQLQRAWILTHLGEVDAARAAFEGAAEDALPFEYRAEYHYTHAVLCLAADKLDEALAAIERGVAKAQRVSSARNGLFLRARIRAARHEHELALADFEQAAAAEFRWQGGDGLLAWGDLLQQLGRTAEARSAWQLAVERDAESESAAVARQRLASAG